MAERISILVTGGGGQVGEALARQNWPTNVSLSVAPKNVVDITDFRSVRLVLSEIQPGIVINAAAYTAVDRAEDEVAAAFAVNGLGCAVLAEETARLGVPLIHLSTDYVFDGSRDGLYLEGDCPSPLNAYGASKLAGELAVQFGNPKHLVLRTSWLVSAYRANFLTTMLRLAHERSTLRVVDDQVGCPTSADDLAAALQVIALRMSADPSAPTGVYHFTNNGFATWAELAREILTQSAANGGPCAGVIGITSEEFHVRARRPRNSRLSSVRLQEDYGIVARDWRAAVADILMKERA